MCGIRNKDRSLIVEEKVCAMEIRAISGKDVKHVPSGTAQVGIAVTNLLECTLTGVSN